MRRAHPIRHNVALVLALVSLATVAGVTGARGNDGILSGGRSSWKTGLRSAFVLEAPVGSPTKSVFGWRRQPQHSAVKEKNGVSLSAKTWGVGSCALRDLVSIRTERPSVLRTGNALSSLQMLDDGNSDREQKLEKGNKWPPMKTGRRAALLGFLSGLIVRDFSHTVPAPPVKYCLCQKFECRNIHHC